MGSADVVFLLSLALFLVCAVCLLAQLATVSISAHEENALGARASRGWKADQGHAGHTRPGQRRLPPRPHGSGGIAPRRTSRRSGAGS
jgi:hypothetical protein